MKAFAVAVSLVVAASVTMPTPVLARGGHGYGHRGFAMANGYRYGTPPGWHRGRKVGWRHMGCPPGLLKQGRC